MHTVLPGPLLCALLALAMSSAAAVYDIRARRIPSWLTLPALAIGPALHGAVALGEHARGAFGLCGPTLEGMLSLAGALACVIAPLTMWHAGVMGGGDCKLLASSGALLGASLGIRVELVSLLLAGYFGLARLAFRGQLLSALGRSAAFACNPLLPRDRRVKAPAAMLESLPLGPFVLASTILVLLLPVEPHHPSIAGHSQP
jgi:Flp pilus assembly protein protease CpaA